MLKELSQGMAYQRKRKLAVENTERQLTEIPTLNFNRNVVNLVNCKDLESSKAVDCEKEEGRLCGAKISFPSVCINSCLLPKKCWTEVAVQLLPTCPISGYGYGYVCTSYAKAI